MRPRYVVALLLLIAAPASAQPPVARISGPSEARTGEIIILDCSESQATHFKWVVDVSGVDMARGDQASLIVAVERLRQLGYKVEEPTGAVSTRTHVIVNDGKSIVLGSYAGTWRVTLGVSNPDGIDIVQWTVKVTENGEPTPPGDPPGDPDPPTGPPPLDLDLTVEAKAWFQTVPVEARVRAANVRETINEVGSRAKEIGSIEACDVLLALGLTASFESDAAKWKSFSDEADKALGALKAKGVTVEQYGQALVSISRGLE